MTYTAKEAAEHLGVSERSVHRRAKSGVIVNGVKVVRVSKGQYKIVRLDDDNDEQRGAEKALQLLNDDKKAGEYVERGTYIYSPSSDEYIFSIKEGRGSPKIVRVDGNTIREWYEYYTSPGATINSLCSKFGVSRARFLAIKSALYLTKSDLGITEEDIALKDEDESVRSALQIKKRRVEQRVLAEEQSMDRRDAQRFRFLRENVSTLLEELEIPTIGPAPKRAHEHAEEYTLIYCLADAHFGKKNVFDKTYDAYKQSDEYSELRVQSVTRAIKEWGTPNEIVYVNLGDFFHVDTYKGQTTSQSHNIGFDVSVSLVDMMRVSIEFILKELMELSAIANVRYIGVPGNHDRMSMMFLSVMLSKMFAGNESIVIENQDGNKHHMFSAYNTPILATHGDTLKASAATAMLNAFTPSGALDRRKSLVLTGHYHSLSFSEKNYVSHIVCKSPAPTDRWHLDRGYISRRGVTILKVSENGLSSMIFEGLEDEVRI